MRKDETVQATIFPFLFTSKTKVSWLPCFLPPVYGANPIPLKFNYESLTAGRL